MSFNAGAKTSLLQYPTNNRICGDSTRRRMMVRNGIKPVGGKVQMDSSRSLQTAPRPKTMPPVQDNYTSSHHSGRLERTTMPPKAASFGPPARPTQSPPRAPSNAPEYDSSYTRNLDGSSRSQQQNQRSGADIYSNMPPPSAPLSVRQRSEPVMVSQHQRQPLTASQSARTMPTHHTSSPPLSVRSSPGNMQNQMQSLHIDDTKNRKGRPIMDDYDPGNDSLLDTDSSSIIEWDDSADSITSREGNGIRERAKIIRTMSKNLVMPQYPIVTELLPAVIPSLHDSDIIPLLAPRVSYPDDEIGSDEVEF